MDLPWGAAVRPAADTTADGAAAGTEAYVMASKFELTSGWRTPAFLAQSIRAWRQARRSPIGCPATRSWRIRCRCETRAHGRPG